MHRRTCPKRESSTRVLDFLWWGRTDSICIFFLLGRKLWCHARLDGHEQLSTGQLRLDGFESLPLCKTKQPTPKGVSCFVAIADKIDAVDFGIKIRKLEKMLCCNNFSHFDAWIFLIFIIGQNRCIHLNFCSGNELEDFKKDFDPSNIGILQYTPLAHAHKTIHRSQKC